MILQYMSILNLTIYLPLPVCCLFSYVFMYYLASFYFSLNKSLQHFLCGRSSGDELPQLFICLGKSSHCFHFWWTTLLGEVFLVFSFLLSALYIYHSILPWPIRSLLINPLIALWVLLCMRKTFFFKSCSFTILSLSLILDSHIIICLEEDDFGLNLGGDLLVLWTLMSESLHRFGKLLVTISLNKLSTCYSLFSPSGTPMMCTLFLIWCPIKPAAFLKNIYIF